MLLVWVFVFVSGFVWLADGSCFFMQQPPRNLNGCVDKTGQVIGFNETRFDYDECFYCYCGRGALHCCGLGYNAGVMEREGCTLKRLARCDFMFVSKEDGVSECTH
ncbi:uncharacterized protein LOC133193388 [Saccostrea echinata]|uniref:uncharacterized protein LOC133193388 n=1 Tax=Saccostrea echinata TaxID=191078 RepID=UPI002A817A01|nr:uncharacterized protein LOC133193388 [Saccostrea echinata]